MLKRSLNTAGDTIVEVLIATAILGFVMGGAYALTSRTLQTSRSSQERVEAITLVEGQLERIKYEARSNPNFDSKFRVGSSFCLKQVTGDQKTLPDPANCNVGPNGRYRLSITYIADPRFTTPNKLLGTFNVQANWERADGEHRQEQLIINYKT